MGGTTSMLYSGAVEAAPGTIVSGAVSSVTNIFEMQEGIDATLYSMQQELMKIQCAINAARGRQITDQKLLEWLAQIIYTSYLGNYIYHTFKHWNSLPLMIESEGMDNLDIYPDYPVAKRQRTIKTLLFGDEENMKLHDVLKMLKSIDIYSFLLMVNAQPESPMKTYLYMDRNRLFGRDKERQQVMNFLFKPSKAGESNVGTLPIVGSTESTFGKRTIKKELNHSMWGIGNTLFNAALEAATGMAVSSAISYLIEKRKNGSKRQLEAGVEMAASTLEMHEGLDVTLCSLQQQLMKIRCAISAARRRRITNQELLEWLAQIINASYLANYYHRTLKHRNSLPLMIGSEGTNNLAISSSRRATKRQRTKISLLSDDDESMKLHDVLKMLKSIDIHAFLLMVNVQPERPMKTYLNMVHSILLYRDKERQQVMNFLFEPSRAGGNNVDILPIVGSRGGGKTSLALHCFDDPKVQHHFSLKFYIPVANISYCSRNFSNVWRDIIREFCHTYETRYYYDDNDENTLLAMVKQILSSKRFLLVLDHIWGIDPMVCNALLDCLRCGKQGSKVILVSNISDYEMYKNDINPEAAMPVMVDGFSEDEYMSFFMEHAFGGADPEDYPELPGMGREIAKKMNGSIWGAKMLGELLRDNLTAPFWSNFLQAGFLSPLARSKVVPLAGSKDIWSVIQIMCLLLPKSLQLGRLEWYHKPVEHEVKTFRELTVLGPNHCTPLIKDGNNCEVRFLVREHVYLNRCTTILAFCKPFGDKSTIVLEDSNS